MTAARPLGVSNALVLAFGGVVLGAFGGFLQAWQIRVGEQTVPVGLVLVLACLIACIRAVIHAYDTRRAGGAFFVGWLVVSVLLALPIAGDIVIGRNGLAITYLALGVILGSAAANLPARLRPVEPGPLVEPPGAAPPEPAPAATP